MGRFSQAGAHEEGGNTGDEAEGEGGFQAQPGDDEQHQEKAGQAAHHVGGVQVGDAPGPLMVGEIGAVQHGEGHPGGGGCSRQAPGQQEAGRGVKQQEAGAGQGGKQAAQNYKGLLPAQAVGGDAQGDAQQGLGEAVGAGHQAHVGGVHAHALQLRVDKLGVAVLGGPEQGSHQKQEPGGLLRPACVIHGWPPDAFAIILADAGALLN